MPTPRFITRLNWRQILLHFVACWCFAYAFYLFSYLHDLELIRALEDLDHTKQIAKAFYQHSVGDMLRWLACSPIFGQSAAFIIAVAISFKKRWFWLNSFIAFLVSYFLVRFKLDGWRWLKYILLKPGHLFAYHSAGYFITNGSVLLLLGLLCLFLPAAIRFIEAGVKPKAEEKLDDINFTDCSPAITIEDIRQVETELQLKFPEDFVQVYLKFNGGCADRRQFPWHDADDAKTRINCFFSIKHPGFANIETVYRDLVTAEKYLPQKMAAFAADDGGNFFCISCDKVDYGEIFYCENEHYEPENFGSYLKVIEKSYTAFLNRLV